jgi:hypothetical protein
VKPEKLLPCFLAGGGEEAIRSLGGDAIAARMEKHVMWAPWDEPGLEHLYLLQKDSKIVADGMILRVKDGIPFRVRYKILCDLLWNVQKVEIILLDSARENLSLRVDGLGHWINDSGNHVPFLDGCIDVDISITAFTNTLPIRRINLKPGESSDVSVVYIAIPEMEVKPSKQRYTCLQVSSEGGVYRYEDEGLFCGFTTTLKVDADGLVVDYPELFRRVWSS